MVTKKAVPEVLLKVVEAETAAGVSESVHSTGSSRYGPASAAALYKYKDDIFPFHDNAKGKNDHVMIRWMMRPDFVGCHCISWQIIMPIS